MKSKILSLLSGTILSIVCNNIVLSQEFDCPGCVHDMDDDHLDTILPGTKSPVFSEFGNYLPPSDTVRVLVIFAEVDRSLCGPCPTDTCQTCNNSNPYDAVPYGWTAGTLPDRVIDPITQSDIFSNSYFDRALPSGATPTPGNITDFYYQMSLGQHVLLGDYYPEIITIPCTLLSNQGPYASTLRGATISIINNKTLDTTSGEFASKSGWSLHDFDKISNANQGILKAHNPDGNIDCIIYVFRNLACNYIYCGGGNGVSLGGGGNYYLKQNANDSVKAVIGAGWRSCDGGTGMFLLEYMHALFGHNNWHSGNTGSEPESRTFLQSSNTYSLTSYSAVGALACGFDRNHLGWHGWKNNAKTTKKDSLISTADTTITQEEYSDMSVQTFPNGGTFILRDFVTYSDAIRIKLPYIKWTQDGNVKNQYLWLENHQKISPHDKSRWEPSTCKKSWSKGIYSYIQVGKDIKQANNAVDVFNDAYWNNLQKPSTLGSWFFALTAEGNYDYKYHYDLASKDSIWNDCVWNNNYLPVDKYNAETKPNPFTGMNDLFNYADYDNDGILRSAGDTCQPWTAEVIDGAVEFHAYAGGDSLDAFQCGGSCPKKILSLGTNPAPVPIYTYKSNSYDTAISGKALWENRTIYLNGISVQILQENVDGNGALKVRVRFDDYEVQNDVRWCGNIVLNPNFQNPNANPNSAPNNYALNLLSNKTLLLDRGKSPTQHIGVKDASNNFILGTDGRKIFTQPTQFTILPNAYFHTEENSTVTIDNGSALTVQSGGRLELHGQMLIRNQGKLVIEDGAIVALHRGAKIIVEQDGILEYKNTTATAGIFFGSTPAGFDEPYIAIGGGLSVAANTTFTFSGNGYIWWKDDNYSTFGTGAKFMLNGSGKTDLLMKFDTDVIAYLNDTKIDIRNGKIQHSGMSNFAADNCDVFFQNLNFMGSTAARGFHGYNLQKLICSASEFNQLNTGIFLESIFNAQQILVANTQFNSCTLAIYGTLVDAATFNSVTVSLAAGNNEFDFNGFLFDQCRVITVGNCNISGINDAITLNNVSGFYMNGGLLSQNYYRAIYADNSLVFMRNGATISDHNGPYPIEIHGVYDSGDGYTAMLTMGDVGCGNIRNCGSSGAVDALIYGTDFILNIDAIQHAYNRANPTDPDVIPQPYIVYPNRFDGNYSVSKFFKICYSASGVYPGAIFLNGNYWGETGYGSFYPVSNKFSFKKNINCYGGSIAYELCQFVPSNAIAGTNSCQYWGAFSTCRKGNGANGGKPEIIGPPKFEDCPAKSKDLVRPIHEVFKEANMEFMVQDEVQIRTKFKDISELKLIKEPNEEFYVCRNPDAMLCESPGQDGGNKEKISHPCAQLVMVAKVLYKEQLQARIANPEQIQSENQPQQNFNFGLPTSDFRLNIFPNPNDGTITVKYILQEKQNAIFAAFDLTGRKVFEYMLPSEKNQLLLNENQLKPGIYYYTVIINGNTEKVGKLTIIK